MKKISKILLIIFIFLICSLENVKADELPQVYFEGNIKEMNSKKDERKIKITYISKDITFDAYALIKIQGTSSLAYEKKNYTIKLYQDDDYKKKKKVDVGFGDENKYCLKANWIDKTHARNIVTARIASDIQKRYNLFMNTPNNGLIDGFPVEIYINDEFLGIYTWNIPKDDWQFNMDENNPNHIVLSGAINSEATFFNELATFNDWEVEVGPENEETLAKFNRVLEFISTSTDEEFRENFEQYLNLDATLNYYIMMELAELLDNTSKNILMVTYDGQIWYPSLYDLDTSWGTTWSGLELYDYNTLITEHASNNSLWTKFERTFANEIAERYFELRKDLLTKENILNEFNTFINNIPASTFTKENKRWSNIPGYNINQIKDFLNARIPLIDKKMTDLYDIIPSVSIEYSTTELTLKPVEVTLTPNRNDITILINGEPTYDYNYTFQENGEYTFEYQDGMGNKSGIVTIKVDWIIKNEIITIFIALTFTIFGAILIYYQPKKKIKKKKQNKTSTKVTKKDNPHHNKEKNSKTKSQIIILK